MLQSKRRKEAISEVSGELGISEQEAERLAAKLASNERFVEQFLKKLDFRIARRVMLAMAGGGLLGALIPKSLAAGGGVICDFVEAEKQRFYPAAVGPYSAIVNQEENYVWAEDCYGKTVEDGESEDAGEVIQAGVDYVAGKGGGVVWIREGEYTIKSKIQVGQNLRIRGCGQNTKLKGSVDPIIEVRTSPTSTAKFSTIENLWIEGNGENTGVKIVDSYGTVLDKLAIYNFKYNILVTDESYWSEGTQIRDCNLSGIKDTGIRFEKGGGTGGYQGTTFQNVRFHLNNENTKGIAVLNGANLRNAAFLTPQMWISVDNVVGIYVDGSLDSAWGLVRIENLVESPTAVYAMHVDVNASLKYCRLIVFPTGPYVFTEEIKFDASDAGWFTIFTKDRIYHGADWPLKAFHLGDKKMIALGWHQGRSQFEVANYDAETGTWEPEDYPLTFLCATKFQKRMQIPTSAPSTPAEGAMYFDPSTNTLYIYNGTSWVSVTLS